MLEETWRVFEASTNHETPTDASNTRYGRVKSESVDKKLINDIKEKNTKEYLGKAKPRELKNTGSEQKGKRKKGKSWQGWDSNPRPLRDTETLQSKALRDSVAWTVRLRPLGHLAIDVECDAIIDS